MSIPPARLRFFRIFFRVVAVLATALLLTAPAYAYVILLKDGSTRLLARAKPTRQGNMLIFIDNLGTRQSIKTDEVDFENTEKANQEGIGDSYSLADAPGKAVLKDPKKKTSLSEYIKKNQKSEIKEEPVAPPKAAGGESPEKDSSATGTGPGSPGAQLDPLLAETFTRAFESSGLRGSRFTSQGNGIRVQAYTDSEAQVLAALGAAARALKESRSSGHPVEKVELHMASPAGENAGRFVMNGADADSLLNGKISAVRFFMNNVIF